MDNLVLESSPDAGTIEYFYDAAGNLWFPELYYDDESGLRCNYFRDYDVSTGRYVESDPLGLEDGLIRFAFVSENPLRYLDPTGTAIVVDDTAGVPIPVTGVTPVSR